MSRGSQSYRSYRRPVAKPQADALERQQRDQAERDHLSIVCDGRKPLGDRLVAFEWLVDHKAYGGTIQTLERDLCKLVAEAGGTAKGGQIEYRSRPGGRLFRGWAP
jgi:hypothetical protein